MHGQRDKSIAPRFTMTILPFISVILAGWILLANGLEVFENLFNLRCESGDYYRRLIIFVCIFVYFLRLLLTTFYLIKRKIGWAEIIPVTILLIAVNLIFTFLGVNKNIPLNSLDYVAIILYLFGSYLNTGSELMRNHWKQREDNKGKLYTEGLFKYSMHINYFGDSLLFFGFAYLTRSYWAIIFPIGITIGFIFIHIPTLDKYLKEKYGQQFDEYSDRTKKFIPFIY